MNTFNLTLDLNKSRASSPVRLRQGDAQGTTITALVLDHGATADLTGYTAQFVMDLPDGTHYYRKAASISGNSVSVLVDETQAASVSGRTANAYFQMLQGTTVKASTGSFAVEVLPDALADADVPESYDSAIQDAIDALDAAVADMPDMVEDVLADHPEWTTTVQNGSITKDKLATDLARDRERLLYRLANMLTNTLPEGDVATATDAAKTPVAGLALYGKSTQAGTPTPSAPVAIQSVAGNLLDPVQIFGGASYYTVNADGSVTVTAEDSRVWASVPSLALDAGTYSAFIEGNAGGRVICHVYVGGVDTPWEIIGNNSKTFTLAADGEVKLKVHQGTFPRTVRLTIYRSNSAPAWVPYGHAGLRAKRTSDASTYTVTPIPLDGHELRSLPDGTRDELTVDARGHAVLVQRVGSVDLGEVNWTMQAGASGVYRMVSRALADNVKPPANNSQTLNGRCTAYAMQSANGTYLGNVGISVQTDNSYLVVFDTAYNSASASATGFKTARKGQTLLYPLATPVTHDLGYVDPVPLCGPDLTAQAVPSAPFALTYERDLNATLARLESAIATLA